MQTVKNMSKEYPAIAQKAFDQGNGILRLAPNWVPRSFCVPGRRIKLHPDDYYSLGGARGGIDERWFSSTTPADNGPLTGKNEGLSEVVFEEKGKTSRILLRDAVIDLKDSLAWDQIMETNKYFIAKEQLTKVYEILGKWTNFWMLYRDDDKNGIPQYNDGGSDSGWDNGTAFDNYLGYTVESPDLCAYLVIQMDVLSDIATKLNKSDESEYWKKKADELLDKFIKRLWTGDKFVVKKTGSDIYETQSHSLLGYIPIILGNRLPKEIKAKLIADLKDQNGLLTSFGFATENPKSAFYISDGYWRGPVWAPTTLFMVEGLNDCGEKEFAKDVAKRFCDMCVKSGFAENFEATTGRPLRNPSYTWSSSVFIFFAHKYLTE